MLSWILRGHQGTRRITLLLSKRGFADEASSEGPQYVIGINYKKGGTDPEVKPLSEYPDWLPALAEPQPSLYELRKKLESEGRERMTPNEVRRMTKLWRTQRIKDNNASRSKKKL